MSLLCHPRSALPSDINMALVQTKGILMAFGGNPDSGCSTATDPDMAAWAQTTYGLRRLHGPLTTACSSQLSCLWFHLSAQHMNSSRSLSRPFLYTYLLIVVAPGDPCGAAAGGPRAGLPLTRASVRTCLCPFTYITKTLSV